MAAHHEDRRMLAIAWAGRGHPKNLITRGGLGRLKPLLKQCYRSYPRL
jgi:hypothetical protein